MRYSLSGLFFLLSFPAFAQRGNFQLSVDGAAVGKPRSVNGGTVSAAVVSQATGPTGVVKKQLGTKEYEAFEIGVGLDFNSSFYQVLESSLKSSPAPKFDGQIFTLDPNNRITGLKDFRQATISQVDFPAVDAASKELGEIKIKFKANDIQSSAGGGVAAPIRPGQQWRLGNFRFELDGLETNRVRRVEAFTLKRSANLRSIEISNFKISVPDANLSSWMQWHEDFLIKGHNGDDQEKSGALIFLANDLRTEIARVNLKQCGIYRMSEAKDASGTPLAGHQLAELYCEQADFMFKR